MNEESTPLVGACVDVCAWATQRWGSTPGVIVAGTATFVAVSFASCTLLMRQLTEGSTEPNYAARIGGILATGDDPEVALCNLAEIFDDVASRAEVDASKRRRVALTVKQTLGVTP